MNQKIVNVDKLTVPNILIDEYKDHYFFSFWVAQGAEYPSFNNIVREQIFKGSNSLLIQPVGLESAMSPMNGSQVVDADQINSTTRWKRNIDVNKMDFSIGKVLKMSFANKFSTLKNYLRTVTTATISVFFNDESFWNSETESINTNRLNYLFYAPELNSYDILYISNIQINLIDGNYHSHIISFQSLADKLAESGRSIEQKIQFSAPGDAVFLPEIRPIQKNAQGQENSSIHYIKTGEWQEVPNTKKVYLNKELMNNPGVDNVQIHFKGSVGLISIRMLGRIKDQSNPLIVNRINPILIHELIEPELTKTLFKSKQIGTQLAITNPTSASNICWFKDWREELLMKFDPQLVRHNIGTLLIANSNNQLAASESTLSWANKTISNVVVSGYKNMAKNPFSNILTDKNLAMQNLPDTATKTLTVAQMLNWQAFSQSLNEFLEFGLIQFFNSKSMSKEIGRGVLGPVGAAIGLVFGKAVGAVAGGFIGNQLSQFFNFAPDSWFIDINKWNPYINQFNLIINKEAAALLEGVFEAQDFKQSNLKNNNYLLPVQIFSEENRLGILNPLLISTCIRFSLSNVFNDLKTTSDLISGNKKINDVVDVVMSKASSSFALDLVEIKALGGVEVEIRAFKGNEEVYRLIQKTQAQFADNLKEITTRIELSNLNAANMELNNNYSNSVLRRENEGNWPVPQGVVNDWRKTAKTVTYNECQDYFLRFSVNKSMTNLTIPNNKKQHQHQLVSDSPQKSAPFWGFGDSGFLVLKSETYKVIGQATASLNESQYTIKKQLKKRCAEWYSASAGGHTGLTSGLTSRKCKRWETPTQTIRVNGQKKGNIIYVLLNQPSEYRIGTYKSNINLTVYWYFNLMVKYRRIIVDSSLNWQSETTESKYINLYVNSSNYVSNANSKQSTLHLNVNSAKLTKYNLDLDLDLNVRLSFSSIKKSVN